MYLSRIERETILLFNEAEQTATIETCNRHIQNQLDSYCSISPDIYREKKGEYASRYICPKSWIKVRMPRQLSTEQRQKMALRASQNFGK